jgi:hypothetical protein
MRMPPTIPSHVTDRTHRTLVPIVTQRTRAHANTGRDTIGANRPNRPKRQAVEGRQSRPVVRPSRRILAGAEVK